MCGVCRRWGIGSSLMEVEFSGLRNVQKVGNGFLSDDGCSSLEELDLSAQSVVQEVGNKLLYECSILTKVILPASPPSSRCSFPSLARHPEGP